MKVVLETTHLGVIGGGENYLMRLAMALNPICELYVTHDWPEKFQIYNGFYHKFKPYHGLFEPDIYLSASHFHVFPAIGKRNYVVVFFPKQTLQPKGYDGAISICQYSAGWVKSYWGLDSTVIEPCIEPSLYSAGDKQKKIVSIGHFFEEEDGHSKQQHILASAFGERLEAEGYELVLIGNASEHDNPYLRKVRTFAKGKNIRIEVNKDGAFVKAELSTASHLWSANGYGRSDPAQTEHFGIIILEALASGVLPIVHNSGGAREILGVRIWERPEDLTRLTCEIHPTPTLPERYHVEHFNSEVKKWLDSLR